MRLLPLLAALLLVSASPTLPLRPALAAPKLKLSSRGELGAEGRAFWPDGEAASQDYNAAVLARLEIKAKLKPLSLRFRAFTRFDPTDNERSAFILEEAFLQFKRRWLRIRAGFVLLNWSATEAFHPADVVNSRYFDSNLENAEKYGELMVAARLRWDSGNVELFFLPLVTDPRFSSAASRFNFGPPGTSLGDAARVTLGGEASDSALMPNWAVQLQQTIGKADLALSIVQHVDRQQPLVYLDPVAQTPRPVFQPFWQAALTYQHALGAFLLKSEVAYRIYREAAASSERPALPHRDHAVLAAGAEYTIGHTGGAESTLILEGQAVLGYPSGQGVGLRPLFDNDALAAYRLAFNDAYSRELFASVIVDVTAPDQLMVNVSYGQRLSDVWAFKVGLRFVHLPPDDPQNPEGFENLHEAHQLYGSLTRYF